MHRAVCASANTAAGGPALLPPSPKTWCASGHALFGGGCPSRFVKDQFCVPGSLFRDPVALLA